MNAVACSTGAEEEHVFTATLVLHITTHVLSLMFSHANLTLEVSEVSGVLVTGVSTTS